MVRSGRNHRERELYMLPLRFDQPIKKLVFLARSFGRHALELGNEIPKKTTLLLKSTKFVAL